MNTAGKVRNRRLSPREAMELSKELLVKFKMNISSKGLKSGDILPGEKEISDSYKVPLSIARGLFQSLKKEGFIKSVKGNGVYLLKPIGNDNELIRNKSFLKLAIVAFLESEHPSAPFNRVSGILRFFDRSSAEHHCQTKLFNTGSGRSVELDLMEAIREYQPDGILYAVDAPNIIGKHDREIIEDNVRKLRMMNIPLVVSGDKTSYANNVVFDHEQIASVAMEHLIRLGHSQIAFIQIRGNEYWKLERIEGVMKTMAKHKLAITDDDIYKVDSLLKIPEGVSRFVKEKLKNDDAGYSAVFCSGDQIAAALIKNAERIGIKVPDDMSIVGVDDYYGLRHMDITTVPHSGEEEGRESFELLTEIIRHKPTTPVVKKIKCPLLVRSTTARLQEKSKVA
ncbi:MAG: substrate-binding domain-containing protein [Lentisphaerota bacterium]